LGVRGDVLLLAPSERALSQAGAYVASTVARRAARPVGLVASLGEGGARRATLSFLTAAWRSQTGAGSFDVSVTLREYVVSWLSELLKSARHVHLFVEPERDHLQARIEIEPEPGGLAHELFQGVSPADVSGLLALPRKSALAMLSPSRAGSREQSAGDTERTVQALFGERLRATERAALADALRMLSRARGAYMSYALVAGPEPEFVLRGPVRDAAGFESGLAGLLRALELPSVSSALRDVVGPFDVRRDMVRLAGVNRPAQRARLTLGEQRLELLWLSHAGIGYAVVGRRPAALLGTLLPGSARRGASAADDASSSDGSLAKHPELVALVKQQGQNLGFAAVIDPLQLGGAASGRAPVPWFVGLARRDKVGVFQVSGSRSALAALLGPSAF
ncbi:MAG TPA: hypothetical protein VI072_12705, partial [Polyangiaceae bacterium]